MTECDEALITTKKKIKLCEVIIIFVGEKRAYIDPATFIMNHKTYHDLVFVVGKNEADIEKISAVKCYLVSQSSVFRELLNDSEHEVRVRDVSPEIFKLILIHMYGGKLPPMKQETLAQLALAACFYNIQPLVAKASIEIQPKSPEDIFPALMCVANVSCPNLEPHVLKIIQHKTTEVLSSDEFLSLDVKCLEYIFRQEKLSATELELWKALVRWTEKKAIEEPEKTRRQHIQTILPYVRLNSFTPVEIGKEVASTRILTAEEGMKLLTAVTSNQPWELFGICSIQEKREKFDSTQENGSSDDVGNDTNVKTSHLFDIANLTTLNRVESNTVSNLTVHTLEKEIEIVSFRFESNPIEILGGHPVYSLKCAVTVSKIESGFCKETFIVEIGGMIIGSSDIDFPVKLRNGQPLILEAKSIYNFAFEYTAPHPAYTLPSPNSSLDNEQITVKFNTLTHVKAFNYQV
ncbi:ubiquitin protein ligase binding [Homalodisca vitripennis]|nr:ubiquitin protein ligase binding [Homalodisca vitripennis]